MLAAVLFAPPATNAQQCAGNVWTGCTNEVGVCSPVDRGIGSSGTCQNSPNLPPGEKVCECVGAPEPPPPPGPCNDRTATGKFDCRIDQPVVNRPEWVYEKIVFAPKDTVYVNADGCVQTGGSGDTWKRYVNPSGDNSDHQYHGLVRIPTAKLAGTDVGSTLTRIKDVVGRPLTVTGEDVSESELVLHLGYEDDNYSDNGYYDHDDGTEDQCKGGNGNDGGPAHVTITICRGVPCGPVTSRFPFDVLSNQLDLNGFLYNPHWSWQDGPEKRDKIPYTAECHEFSKYDPFRPWPRANFPDCTDQADLSSVNEPGFLSTNWFACWGLKVVETVGGPPIQRPFPGHVNWFPITVEGKAWWGDHSPDDDYDFALVNDPDSDMRLYTNERKNLHIEFDSDETIDHFQTEEWKRFHDAVDDAERAKAILAQCGGGSAICDPSVVNQLQEAIKLPHTLFEGHTIMTGVFGLDGEHGFKSELHPLYAMATERDNFENDPGDDSWLIFVRNSGDEGFCSSQIWNGGFEDYTFRLPWRQGMTSVDVDWNKTRFEGTDGTSGPLVRSVRPLPVVSLSRAGPALTSIFAPEGVYVTFHLGRAGFSTTLPPRGESGTPASVPYIEGALHLIWKGPTIGSGRRHPDRSVGVSSSATLGSESGSGRPRPGPSVVNSLMTERAVRPMEETDDVEHKLAVAINKLPLQQRTFVQKTRAIGSSRIVVHQLASGGPVEVLKAPPVTGISLRSTAPHEPIAGRAGPATRKLAGDAAQMRALCSATNNAPSGLPPEVCRGLAVPLYFGKSDNCECRH